MDRDPYAELARLYAFFRREFFNFDTHFSAKERLFAEECMKRNNLEWARVFNDDFSYSLFSFSHRVSGASLNSSRVSFGAEEPEPLHALMAEVLKEWGTSAKAVPLFEQTFGLGWDIIEGIRKTYIWLDDVYNVPDEELARMIEPVIARDVYPQCLASVSIENGQISEKKVYVALRDRTPPEVQDWPFLDAVSHTNFMVTSERGVVPQVDLKAPLDVSHFNPIAAQLVECYASIDIQIDTVAYQDRDNYVLYVPA